MQFNPENPDDIVRLNAAIEESVTGLSKYRKNYALLLDKLSDPCHEDRPKIEDRQVEKKLDDFFTILTRSVVSRNPNLRIAKTSFPRVAGMLKQQIEDWGDRHNIAAALGSGFHELLLRWCIGYMYVEPQQGGGLEPYLKILDFEDYFIDMRQTNEAEIDFEGHEYEMLRDELSDPNVYDQEAVNTMGSGKHDRNSTVQRPLYERVSCRAVYLPRHQLILTLSADGGDKALRIQRYNGPPHGPYIRAHLTKRRGTIIPTSRASMLMDLHDFCAVTKRQVFMQADQFCEFFMCDSAFTQAADIHRTAKHGEYYTVDNKDAVARVVKGGVNQGTMLASMQADDLFNEKAGNLKFLSGQGTGEPTARQASQVGVGVDHMVRDCRMVMNGFAKRVYENVAWYILFDDTIPPKQVEWRDEMGVKAPSWWTPGVGKMLPKNDPQLDIIPDSMILRTSEEQAGSLLESIRAIASLFAVPGNKPVFLDHQELVTQLKDLRNQPELAKLFGQAPDVSSLVPGSETTSGLSEGGGQRQPLSRPAPGDRLKEKLMFNATQPQQAGVA